MTDLHPITPPPELFAQCYEEAERNLQVPFSLKFTMSHAIRTAYAAGYAAGADKELEACCEWLFQDGYDVTSARLRNARRPKPPSLRKQAYDALDTYIYGEPDPKDKERTYNTIRRALEALDY